MKNNSLGGKKDEESQSDTLKPLIFLYSMSKSFSLDSDGCVTCMSTGHGGFSWIYLSVIFLRMTPRRKLSKQNFFVRQ